jgi:uncharacterized protein YcgI (DUF1989 family)
METKETLKIDGGNWGHIKIAKGEHVRVTALEGPQVADLWAFDVDDTNIFLSAEHTRSTLEKLMPAVGDALYSNRRHAMLTVVEDTSPGTHDYLMSACDPRRYELLGHEGYHKSCAENLCKAMDDVGAVAHELPSPFNTFQNVEINGDGGIAIVPPKVEAGQYIEMRAESDLLIIISACPMDIADTNGPDGKTRPIKLERLG